MEQDLEKPSQSNDLKMEDEAATEVDSSAQSDETENNVSSATDFKKPLIIFPPKKLTKLMQYKNSVDKTEGKQINNIDEDIKPSSSTNEMSPAAKLQEINVPLQYKEPKWSGLPTQEYSLEILKSGTITRKIDLRNQPFQVFGRLMNCDVTLAHPSISRHHAILQYKAEQDEDSLPVGFYIYDLDSTHGTFLNKERIKPNTYIRVHVGHMFKFGLSSRNYILLGPDEDQEAEAALTLTELKQVSLQKKLKRDAEQAQAADSSTDEKEQGISWGIDDDAEEEPDLSFNPFAASQNEELYINDPKKSLRGWFEREGYELEYDCEEKGYAQFVCRVQLPIDSERGTPVIAEAIVQGKKKEAVIQCALEACRILDQHGLLRQSQHESKKRKLKNWEENDFYDSDEDTFLDRTGTVEKKRQIRMQLAGKGKEEVHTYQSLLEKHKKILSEISTLETEITTASAAKTQQNIKPQDGEDALDRYMLSLSACKADAEVLKKSKLKLASLKEEELRICRLANIAKPPGVPDLQPLQEKKPEAPKKLQLPLFGKRKIGAKRLEIKKTVEPVVPINDAEYESDSD